MLFADWFESIENNALQWYITNNWKNVFIHPEIYNMKNYRIFYFSAALLFVFLAGCRSLSGHNFTGMSKQEVAAHLEKNAFRSRWSGNKFEIEILQKQIFSRSFKNTQELLSDKLVMSADLWRCNFYPRRHWLFGWDSSAAKWHFLDLQFKDGKVTDVQSQTLDYQVKGKNGQSPCPQFPWNFHKVNDDLYRSGQPDADEFESLYTFNGIRSVLNLRESSRSRKNIDAVNRKLKNAITLYEVPLDTNNMSEKDLYKILTVLRDAEKPVLIHCLLGSNRTGCAVAAYRIVLENRSVDDAVRELMAPRFGHHKIIYPNIAALLRKVDWSKLKTMVSDSAASPGK